MQATPKFTAISHLLERSTNNHFVQEFCRQTGCKVQLERRKDGRILAYVGTDNWISPSFGSASELIAYVTRMAVGIVTVNL